MGLIVTTLLCGAALLTAASATSAATLPTDPPGTPSIAKTPPMGFNGWLNFGCNVDEQRILDVADAFVNQGLRDAGYRYVNLDDCWMAHTRDSDGRLQADPARFPHGMAWLADQIHARGLKFGIYSAASATTCQGYPASAGHYAIDMQTFANWGVDYLKLDLCGSEPNNLIRANCDNTTASRDFEQRYAEAARAIRATGRPMILGVSAPASIAWWCGYDNVSYRDAMAWAPKYGELWRTAVDAGQNWNSLLSTYTQNVTLADFHSVGHWNDADMLMVGSARVSLVEQQTQFTLWAAMAAPLLISTDLTAISPEALSILTNRDVIAINQDPLGAQGRIVASDADYDVLAKPLANGDRAVVLFNKSDQPRTITTDRATIGFQHPGTYFLKDLVSKARTRTAGTIAANVPAHGTVMYRVSRHADGDEGPYGPSTVVSVHVQDAPDPGPLRVAVTFANNGTTPATNVEVTLSTDKGWPVTPAARSLHTLYPGAERAATFEITNPSPDPGRSVTTLRATVTYDYPGGPATTIHGESTIITDTPYDTLEQAFNNVGITDDSTPSPGNFDGAGNSYSAQALATAGLTPGGTFTHDGLTFTWPTPIGTPNNVVGDATIRATGTGSRLGFLGAGIGSPSGTGTITYTDGTTQTFELAFPNWASDGPDDAVVSARYRNTQSGPANQGYYYRVFYRSIELQPDKQVATVTLPDNTSIHVFAMAIG